MNRENHVSRVPPYKLQLAERRVISEEFDALTCPNNNNWLHCEPLQREGLQCQVEHKMAFLQSYELSPHFYGEP